MSFRQGYSAFLFQDEKGMEEEEEEGEDNSTIILFSIYYAITQFMKYNNHLYFLFTNKSSMKIKMGVYTIRII